MGIQSATLRRHSAYVGEWEQAFSEVAKSVGCTSAAEFAARCPHLTAGLTAAGARLADQGVHGFEWSPERCLLSPMRKRQHAHMDNVYESLHMALWRALGTDDRGDLRSAGGPIAGAFLGPSQGGEDAFILPDDHLKVAIRRRLRLCCPGFCRKPHTGSSSSSQCKHKAHTGARTVCGKDMDAFGRHAGSCHVGGLIDLWHDNVRNWLLKWVAKMTGRPTFEEPLVSEWNYYILDENNQPKLVQAQLDGGFVDRKGKVGFFDVAIVAAHSTSEQVALARAHVDGLAAKQEADEKRRTYPPAKHPRATLVPFVLESLGRPSEEAVHFLQSKWRPRTFNF